MKKNKGLGIASLIIIITLIIMTTVLIALKLGKNKDDKTMAYTDLIRQVAEKNVVKVEMTTGSNSIKILLKKEIDKDGNIVEGGAEYVKEEEDEKEEKKLTADEEKNKKLIKDAIVPSIQSFIELIQN